MTSLRPSLAVGLMFCVLLVFGTAFAASSALTVSRIEPNTAPTAGGTRFILVGSGFDTSGDRPVKVFVGGKRCSDVTVHSSWRLSAVVPPSDKAGAVDVGVRSGDDGPLARLKQGLCYDDGSSWLARWYRIKGRAGGIWLLMEQGGSIMFVLTILSILGGAWVIHCALVIRQSQIMPKGFLDRLSGHLSRSEIQEAIDACQREEAVFGRIAVAALRKSGEPPQKIREVAQAAGSREASHLSQKISYLSNLGVISPLLGLLGTVLGMILAFRAIGFGMEEAQHIVLAQAIFKAMTTTAGGLVVGIPAMACFYYFRGKLLRIVTEMEQVAEEVADAVAAAGEGE